MRTLVIALGLVGCISAGHEESVHLPAVASGEPEAVRLVQAWFDQNHGFDAIEAWEIHGFELPVELR